MAVSVAEILIKGRRTVSKMGTGEEVAGKTTDKRLELSRATSLLARFYVWSKPRLANNGTVRSGCRTTFADFPG